AVELPPRDRQVARDARAGREHDRVVPSAQLGRVDVAPHVDAEAELDALAHQLLHAALDDALFDLELRHSEADEAAGGLVALEDGHRMTAARQLLCRREARRARADDGHRPTGRTGG